MLTGLLVVGLAGVGWLAYDQYQRAEASEAELGRLSGELDTERAGSEELRARADSLLSQVDGLTGEIDSLKGSLSSSRATADGLRTAQAACVNAIDTGERILAGTRSFIEATSTGNGLRAEYVVAELEPLWDDWDAQSSQCRGTEPASATVSSADEATSGDLSSDDSSPVDSSSGDSSSGDSDRGESWLDRNLPDWLRFG